MKTERMIHGAVAILSMMALSGTALGASGSFSLSPMSGYMWRGQYYSDKPVLQTDITVSDDSGFSLNTWGNIDLDDINDARGDYTELDVTVSYDVPLEGMLGLSVGFIQYTFPAAGGLTREVYASVSADTVLSPALTVYADIDAAEGGFYGLFEVSHGFALTDALSLELGASIGYGTDKYNDLYFGVDDNLLNDLNVGATLTYSLSESFSIAALVTYTTLLDSDIKAGARGELDEEFAGYYDTEAVVAGLSLSYEF